MRNSVAKYMCMFLLCLVVMMVSGCAFMDARIDLPYQQCIQGYAETGTVEIEKPVYSLPQKDSYTVVGYIRNGIMIHTADVLTDNNVGDWIVYALRTELEASGYVVRLTQQLSPNSKAIGIKINISRVFADVEGFCVVAHVEYTLDIQECYKPPRAVAAHGTGSYMGLAYPSKSYAKSLEIALQNSVKDVIPKIVAATHKTGDIR